MRQLDRRIEMVRKQHVRVWGNPNGRTIVFGHGFGWTQEMWQLVAPAFMAEHTVVLYDLMGASTTASDDYDFERYATLHGYAEDLIEMLDALGYDDVVYVGHSMSGMVGLLAAAEEPSLFSDLVLLSPSPRYVDDDGYRGGLTSESAQALVESVRADVRAWGEAMAPAIMSNPDRPWLAELLADGIGQIDPEIAAHVAEVVFLGDYRSVFSRVRTRTLLLQAADDVIVPPEVIDFMHRRIPGSSVQTLRGTGHAANLSAPGEVTEAISAVVRRASADPRQADGRCAGRAA